MNTAVATTKATPLALDESHLINVLESSLYPGAKPASIALVIGYCKAQGLDPLQKPVHIVPMSVKNAQGKYEFRDVIMPGIGLYRVQASRTGEYAGVAAGEFGPDVDDKLGNVEMTYPEWCAVTVYRMVQGQRVGFSSGRVYWLETYATANRDTDAPNSMWRKRPRGQLEKCAEALALRRGFPELGAQPTAEELEGKTIDADTGEIITHDKPTVQQPTSKSGKSDKAATDDKGQPDTTPASAGMLAHVRKRLEAAALTEAECFKKFGMTTFDGATVARANEILHWIANPAPDAKAGDAAQTDATATASA